MKKKHIAMILLFVGIILVCSSVVLAVVATSNKNIIGGADWPTFQFVYFYEKRGLYSTLTFLGITAIIVSIVMGVFKKKK